MEEIRNKTITFGEIYELAVSCLMKMFTPEEPRTISSRRIADMADGVVILVSSIYINMTDEPVEPAVFAMKDRLVQDITNYIEFEGPSAIKEGKQ